MEQIRCCGSENVIVVGHSIFFQALFKRFATGEALTSKSGADLANELARERLPNCGVVGACIDWSDGSPSLVDINMLFGTQMGSRSGSAAASMGQSLSAWVGNLKQ